MKVDERMRGNAGDAHVVTSAGTRCPYHHSPVSYATFVEQTPGLPRSMHTDTDAAMEFDALLVGPRNAPPKGPAKELALELMNHLTKVMPMAAAEAINGLALQLPVTDTADAPLQERFHQRRAAAQHSSTTPATTGWVSVFDWLAYGQ